MLFATETIGQFLIDMDMPERSVPMLTFMEYVAVEVAQSRVLTVKARALKAIALVEIGYLNESMQLLWKILH